MTDFFATLSTVDGETRRRLSDRLAAAAHRDGLLDVAYRTVDSPVGELLLASTDRGLVRVAFTGDGREEVLHSLAKRISPRVLHAPKRLDEVARELDEYFAGDRKRFDVTLDFQLSNGFRRAVLDALRDIRYGTTESYARVAEAAHNPKAVRAVGTACATNPLPIVVPCHRVVRSDGSVGQYAGGPAAKRALLAMEAG